MKEEKLFANLRVFNGFMAVLHFVQGILMLLLSNDFSLPVTTSYLTREAFLNMTAANPVEEFSLRLGPLVAGFLFLSALAHLLLILPGIYEWYKENLKKGINYLRWYEYAFSSSLMIVVIAMLSGIYDMSTLILMFTLNAMMIFFGLVMELHNQTTKKTNWTSFVFGCVAGIVPWIVIAMHFLGAVNNYEESIPNFVYAILVSLFVFFNVFAVNMFLQYRKIGPWKNYLFGEKMYIVLSLLAKSALAWQVFSGTLRP